MRIYRWKKPELTVSLTAGGTLLASTQYWVIGYFKSEYGYSRYFWSGCGPNSDTETFTTDAANKSISIAWKTVGDITEVADAGGGEVLVTSAKHCLDTGDEIIVEGGAYAGTYDITWVSHDTFKITVAFGATSVTTWRCEELPNSAIGLHFLVTTTNPDNADGTWNYVGSIRSQPFTSLYHEIGYTTTPAVITAPPTLGRGFCGNMFFSSDSFDKSWVDYFPYGFPALYGTDTSITLQEIQTEIEAAGLSPYWRSSAKGIRYFGCIKLPNWNDSFNNISIICEYGGFQCEDLELELSDVHFVYAIVRDHCQFIAKNTTLTCPRKIQFDTFPTDESTDNFNPKNINISISLEYASSSKDNIFLLHGGLSSVSYPRLGTLTNSRFYNTPLYIVYNRDNDYPAAEFRTFSGIEIKYMSYTYVSNDLDFLIYTYSTGDYTQYMENIDTDRDKNLKLCMMAGGGGGVIDVVFWRTGTLYLNDALDGATVTIVAGTNTYNYTSVAGEVDFDIIEQLSYPRPPIGNPDDNVVEDIVVTASKAGMGTVKTTFPLARDIGGAYLKVPASGTSTIIYDSVIYDSQIY